MCHLYSIPEQLVTALEGLKIHIEALIKATCTSKGGKLLLINAFMQCHGEPCKAEFFYLQTCVLCVCITPLLVGWVDLFNHSHIF